ncbi:MAG: prepilin-type N-terminal cleavage/methylation domain-containing protein [Candidatus Hydrogenedentales bacterium]
MKRQQGFTLIELLVVVAMIGILAGIIIPNVLNYLSRARATRAVAEIKGIDLALTKMLTDTNRQDFRSFFEIPTGSVFDGISHTELAADPALLKSAIAIYTNAFYILLKQGKNAEIDGADIVLNAEVRKKLGTAYMTDLGKDPWGNLYQFFPGPWRSSVNNPFVVREADVDIPGGYQLADAQVAFTDANGDTNALGFPAPRNETMYIYSLGANLVSNQSFNEGFNVPNVDDANYLGDEYVGGGDDVNSWDTQASWAPFY